MRQLVWITQMGPEKGGRKARVREDTVTGRWSRALFKGGRKWGHPGFWAGVLVTSLLL